MELTGGSSNNRRSIDFCLANTTDEFERTIWSDLSASLFPLACSPSKLVCHYKSQPNNDRQANEHELPVHPMALPKDREPNKAAEIKREAEQALIDTLKSLTPTIDGSLPRIIQCGKIHECREASNVYDLARALLGVKASLNQVDQYARCICQMNILNDDPKQATLKAGQKIQLPGQAADGGIVLISLRDFKRVQYADGTRFTQEIGGGGEIRRNVDGEIQCIRWDPFIPARNLKFTIKYEERIELEETGKRVVLREADKTLRLPGIEPSYDQFTMAVEPNGRQIIATYTGNRLAPSGLIVVEPQESQSDPTQCFMPRIHSLHEVVPDEYLDVTGTIGYSLNGTHLRRFTRLEEAGVITKQFDDGDFTKTDLAGLRIANRYTDSAGRTFEEIFDPPAGSFECTPKQIKYSRPGDSQSVIFTRTAAGRYEGQIQTKEGQIQTAELSLSNLDLVIRDRHKRTVTVESSDGKIRSICNSPHFQASTEITSEKGKLTILRDRQGSIVEERFLTKERFLFTRKSHASGQIDTITILEPDGATTELTMNRDLGRLVGRRKSNNGSIEETSLIGEHLVFIDREKNRSRAVEFSWPQPGNPCLKGEILDADNSTVKRTDSSNGMTVIEGFARGRVDTFGSDGVCRGQVTTNAQSQTEESWWHPQQAVAMVTRVDGSGVRLKNGRIDFWNEHATVKNSELTAAEITFIRSHPEIDLRLIAEVHQRLNGDKDQLELFYKQLSSLGEIRTVTESEKSSLAMSILKHIAHPAEISQGQTFCCNVTVVQRDLAINSPNLYVRTIVRALGEGKIETSDGLSIKLDRDNLKSKDYTGRDIASRVFQSLAVQVASFPDQFRNTPDGAGQLTDDRGNVKTFDGLSNDEIAKLIYDLTGREQALVKVSGVEELAAAFAANGRRPMIICVDALQPPFTRNPSDTEGPHVVTVTGLECIDRTSIPPKYKVFVQNQGGPQSDRSTPQTALDGDLLVQNMLSALAQGNAMIDGSMDKVYSIVDGALKEDKYATEARRQRQELLKKERRRP